VRVRRLLPAAVLCLLAGLAAGPASGKDIVVPARGGAVVGTNKADRISAEGGRAASIRCKAGRDIVTADPEDKVAADCEVVSLRVSRDPYRNAVSQHQTQVEPDSFAFASTEVTTFQSGRFPDGGASNIGWASTTDGGASWKSGFLPGITQFGAPPGLFPRVSDPAVAYDAKHAVWMIASLAFSPTVNAMMISRSADGTAWDLPVEALHSEMNLDYDKEWIACDNWPASPYYGNCYLSYADFGTNKLITQVSGDGGLTWGPQVPSPAFGSDSLNGAQPVVRPDGTLVILFSGRTTLGESISTNGGASFTPAIPILQQDFLDVPRLRSSPFPSAEVDASGTIYAAWNDCGRRRTCNGDDVVFISSADGRTWTQPRRVPTGGTEPGHTYFMPGIGADPAAAGHIGITYYILRSCPCRIGAAYIGSRNGGASWSKPQRLETRPMKPAWLARTTLGLMLGDYISTSFVNGRPIPVLALSSPPVNRSLREATFVTVRGIG
jgi:hypothetical protein